MAAAVLAGCTTVVSPASGPIAAPGGAGSGCTADPGLPAGRTVLRSVNSGGRAREYLLHLPGDYAGRSSTGRPLPVVLVFHGRKGTGSDIEGYSGVDALETIAVYPRGLPGPDGETAWQGAPDTAGVDDVRFIADLLNILGRTLCIDPARVFATGKSEGGGFTALLACRLPTRIAAFGTVSGAFYPGTGQGCAAGRPVPLMDFHGTGDSVIHYDGGTSHHQSYPAMADWLAGRAAADRCAPEATSKPIGSDVTELAWPGCAPGSALVHYRIEGGGHTWPGALTPSGPGQTSQTISATALLWAFFTAHSPPPGAGPRTTG